jgi:hypothetical protein
MTEATTNVVEIVYENIGRNFEVIDMGIQDATLIQPCGMSFTNLKRAVMGTGITPKAAIIAALSEIHNVYKIDGNEMAREICGIYNCQTFPELPNAKAPSQKIVNNPTYAVCIRF